MDYPFILKPDFRAGETAAWNQHFLAATPFPNLVIDGFLPEAHIRFLAEAFPKPDHPIWLDRTGKSPYQFGKLGVGDTSRFHLLEPELRFALQEFNTPVFLRFLEATTGLEKLLPDPYFTGGAMHQICQGGILDVHTDFNRYDRLDLHRQLNVIIYLNDHWQPGHGGELELWDGNPMQGGSLAHKIEPIFNRCVIFKTDKTSFHGHPNEWNAPAPATRRSIALYYYTARTLPGFVYNEKTDFTGLTSKTQPRKG